MDNENFGALAHTLDIEPDYIARAPSEITERLSALTEVDGKEYEIARDNLFSIMKIGGDAMEEMVSLAGQTQHPRMYEVLTELTKTMIQANRELMEIKKLNVDIKHKEEIQPEGTTTNNIVVCSTAELMDMINKKRS